MKKSAGRIPQKSNSVQTGQKNAQVQQMIQSALMLDRQGRPADAENLLRQAQTLNPRHPDVLNLLGVLCLRSNRLKDGIALLKKAIKIFPKAAIYHFNLGNAYQLSGDLNAARSAFIKAIKYDVKMPQAHKNLGVVLSELGQHEAAEQAFAKALKIRPDDQENAINHANALLQLGRKKAALDQMQHILTEASSDTPPMLWRNLGIAFRSLGNDLKAEEAFHKAIAQDPNDAEAWVGLGHALSDLGIGQEAVAAFKKAESLGQDKLRMQYFSADALFEAGDYTEAQALFHDLLARQPDNIELLMNIALTEARLGDFEAQEENLRKVLKINPEHVGAYTQLTQVPGRKYSEEDVVRLQKLANDDSVDNKERSRLGFALGDYYHQKKDYENAFNYYQQGNDFKGFVFDQKSHEESVTALIETFSAEFFEQHADWGNDSTLPVLIVGTPRSGTTLTEQILSSHSKVMGAGERGSVIQLASSMEHEVPRLDKDPKKILSVTKEDVEHFATNYLQVMQSHVKNNEIMVTNKLPGNFSWLGLFSLLFPRAPIIHTRRDPRDSLLSIFFKDFAGAHTYAYNLEDLGFWYRQYERLMKHWEQVLPNPYFALDYEATVADQEGMTHQLLDFLGLEWDERVLEYYKQKRSVKTASLWQVRQPVYNTSVARWKPYEQQLQPLFNALKGESGA